MGPFIDTTRGFFDRNPHLKALIKKTAGWLVKCVNHQSVVRYNKWFQQQSPSREELEQQIDEANTFVYTPLLSVVVPVYNPSIDHFTAMIQSVCAQTYKNWELILVDDASPDQAIRDCILDHLSKDERIRHVFLEKNHQIAGATNEGIAVASGEFIALLDNDDILQPHALFEVAKVLQENKELDFLYSDEEKFIDGDPSPHHSPYFKPNWNPDFLRSVNYITHLAVIRKSILDSIGGENGSYNGAQDWELFLRLMRTISPERVHHIPKILYSWRIHALSTADKIEVKPYVVAAQQKTLTDDLGARGYTDYSLTQDALYPAQWVVEYDMKTTPTVSIIITHIQKTRIQDILTQKLTYDAYEFTDTIQDAKGEFLVFVHCIPTNINHAVDVIHQLLRDAQRPDIGFVAARFATYNDVMTNIRQLIAPDALPLVETMSIRDITKHMYATTRYNVSELAIYTVAMVEKKKLEIVDDMILDISSISKSLHENGYRNLYNPYVQVVK